MVAYLEKIDGNAEFHEIIDFLTRSLIHYALTVSLVVSTMFVEQFWMTAKSKTINNVRYITATVAGKPVLISEASIRSDLQFNDAAGIDVLPNQAIFDTIQLMGYEGDLNTLTFNKGLFSPQWKFLFHTIIHCLSSKSTSWDQIPTNIATAVICLATNQVYNFSKLIFDGMMRHLDAKKKFVMYPRFIPVFLTNQLKNVPVPLDHFPINALTTKVFSFMVKKGKKNSRNVTPLFPPMLAHDQGFKEGCSEELHPKEKGFINSFALPISSCSFVLVLKSYYRKAAELGTSLYLIVEVILGNKQPLDRDITSTTLDEGTAKITPHPKGSLGNKDSGGNIPPADMEPIHTPVADLLGTGAKYQDELEKEYDEEEVLAAGDDMDEDPQDDEEVRTPSPDQTQPEPSHVQEYASDSSSPDLKKFDNTLPLTERQLIKYLRKMSRASIEEYYEENIAHRDQTDQLVATSMSSLEKSSSSISDLYKGLNVITEILKDINNAVKDDPATNKKIDEAIKTFSKIYTQTTEILSLVKTFDFSTLQSTMQDLQAHALKQEEASASWTKSSTNMAWNLGSRMTAVEIS
ncbi:hypothetical protein Tco_1000563 [Tanacetum coccineum]